MTVASEVNPLNNGWLFGWQYRFGSGQVLYNDQDFITVKLLHSVAPLSWGD